MPFLGTLDRSLYFRSLESTIFGANTRHYIFDFQKWQVATENFLKRDNLIWMELKVISYGSFGKGNP